MRLSLSPCRRHRLSARAIEGVTASDKMTVFSNPAGSVVANDTCGGKGEESSCSMAVQNQSGLSVSAVAPVEENFIVRTCSPGGRVLSDKSCACETRTGLSRVGHGGTERCLESTTPASTTRTASAAPQLRTSRFPPDIELDEEHGGACSDTAVAHVGENGFDGVAARPETLLMMPAELVEGATEGIDDVDIAAADWLDAHALLDAAI